MKGSVCTAPVGKLLGPRHRSAVSVAQAAAFDGSTTYGSRSGFSGVADSKSGTIAFWSKRAAVGSLQTVIQIGGRFKVEWQASNRLLIEGKDTGDTVVLSMQSNTVYSTVGQWLHVAASWRTNAAGASNLYANGVEDELAGSTFVDTKIDLTTGGTSNYLGAATGAANLFNGCLGQIWFTPDEHVDLGAPADLAGFYDGGWVDYGSDGSTPTGTQPPLFFDGSDNGIYTNKGSSPDDYTATGTLIACGDVPS